MNLVKWNPLRELDELSERMSRLFGSLKTNGGEALTIPEWAPAVDIAETDSEFLVKADLPDMKKENVKVTVEEGVIRIEGERKQEKEEKGKKFHRIERSYGSFVRSFTLPENVDEKNIKAEFKDGVLSVHLPKAAKAKPKGSEIKID